MRLPRRQSRDPSGEECAEAPARALAPASGVVHSLPQRAPAGVPTASAAPAEGAVAGDGAPASPTGMSGSAIKEVTLESLEDFDQFGGGTQELVTWELGLQTGDLAGTWQALIDEQLIEPAGTDPIYRETMFRITPAGTEELARLRNQ